MSTGNVIVEDIKQTFKRGSYLTKLIYINLAVFLLVGINGVILALGGAEADSSILYLGNWLHLRSNVDMLLVSPWRIITYMFLHEGFLHVLFNVIGIYWSGKLFLQFFDQKKLLSVYLLGGIVGGLTYVVVYNVLPVFQDAALISNNRGASGSLLAIIAVATFYDPKQEVLLPFLGRVKLYYIGLFFIISSFLSLAGNNAGGEWTHLGGVLYGLVWMTQMRKGKNIGAWFDNVLDWFFTIFKPRPKMRVKYNNQSAKPPRDDKEYNREKKEQQDQVDEILEKISKKGYDALTKKEKDVLFRAKNQ